MKLNYLTPMYMEGDEPGESGPGGTGESPESPSWLDSLPDDLKSNETLTRFKDPASLASSYLEARSKIGADMIARPGQDAGPEQWDSVFEKLGKPESPDDYQLTPVEGVEIQQEMAKSFKEQAHKAGLLPSQVDSLFGWYSQTTADMLNAENDRINQLAAESTEKLKEEFGSEFDSRIQAVSQMIDYIADGDEELIEHISKTFGNDAAFIKIGDRFAKMLTENKLIVGEDEKSQNVHSAQEEIDKMMNDNEGPYRTPGHPGHKDAVNRMNRLREIVHGKDVIATLG